MEQVRPNTAHVIYVQAVNSKGAGPISASLTVKTLEDVPEEAPLNVACVSLNSQSLQITWQPPRLQFRNGLIRGYRVFYKRLGDVRLDGADGHQVSSSQTTSELTLFLSNLQKFSNYSVKVFEIDFIRVLIYEHLNDTCSFWPISKSLSSLLTISRKEIFYRFSINFQSAINQNLIFVIIRASIFILLFRLMMKVLAFTALGDGVVSAPLICGTDEDIAEMPTKVTVVPSSIDSLIVNWLPNRRTTGRLIHFTVYSKEVERGEDVNAQKWTVNPQLNRLEIRNLRRRTVFYFQVAASTQAGSIFLSHKSHRILSK